MNPSKIRFTWDEAECAMRSQGLVIPDGKSGKWRIEHHRFPVGTKVPIVSPRNALLMGMRPTSCVLPRPLIITNLVEKDGDHTGLWMSDSPQEVEQHVRQLRHARGHVLVGGLGIGLAVSILARKMRVRSITVVEKSKDVIKLVKPTCLEYIHDRGIPGIRFSVVHEDLFEFLKHGGAKFNFAFLDIWCPTSEGEFMATVMPLRKLARNLVSGHIECWNEAEMLGQFRLSIHTALAMQGQPNGIPIADYIQRVERMKPRYAPCLRFYKMYAEGKANEHHVESFISALRDGKHEEWTPERE